MDLALEGSISPKLEDMPNERERAILAIELSNKFKAKAIADENDKLYVYANLLWVIAYQSGQCNLVYEDAGHNPYFDLAGLAIDGSYSVIPVPLLQPTEIAGFMKAEPELIKKRIHKRIGIPCAWEDLMPEFIFLCLQPEMQIEKGRRSWNNLWILDWDKLVCSLILDEKQESILPQNPKVYNSRLNADVPIHDLSHHQWATFKCFKFKTFKSLAPIFEPKFKSIDFNEVMNAKPRTLGETLDAIAPFLSPGHCDRIREALRTNSPITSPTEEETAFIRQRVDEACEAWGENEVIHFETLAHWLSCFSIPRPTR